VTWSVVNGTGQATINASGLLTAIDNGTVTARATANDGSGVSGTLGITLSNQMTPVASIVVSGAAGATTITTDNGTLQLAAAVMPANVTDTSVTWSVINGTGQATINATGLLTAVDNGTVTATATANDGSGESGSLIVTLSNQLTPVVSINVSGDAGATTITLDKGTLQLIATVIPAHASDTAVTWSVVNGTEHATINAFGLITAIGNGTVTARATANDGSGVYGDFDIIISNQVIVTYSESKTIKQLNLFPNPASDEITVDCSSSGSQKTTIEIFDLYGKLIYLESFKNQALVKININNLMNGAYIIRTNTGINSLQNILYIVK
jgi:uncharacterized protein YjdB